MAGPFKTASELETDVRANLDEATAAFWTQANLLGFLSQAAHSVWMEMRKLRQDFNIRTMLSTDSVISIFGANYTPTSSLAIVAGTKQYTLPGDFVEMRSIECITSGYEQVVFDFSRDQSDPEFLALRALTTSQTPAYFFVDIMSSVGDSSADVMLLSHASDTALDIRIRYVSSAVIFSNAGAALLAFAATNDVLRLPHPLYLAVEAMATVRAKMKEMDAGMAGAWQQMATQTVARFLGSSARQSQDIVVGYSPLE